VGVWSCFTDSYIKAGDPSNYDEVIETASRAGKHDDLVRYLQMARKTLREPRIDTELAVAYARTDRLHDMEEFLGMTNVADQLTAGELCFEAGLYDAARLLFSSISNYARLATTLIYLGENQAAVDAARKAGNTQYVAEREVVSTFSVWAWSLILSARPRVWKQVNAACVDKKEFRLAQICGLNLIVHAEELQVIESSSSMICFCHIYLWRLNRGWWCL
jgi:clathrin heavy chain